MIHDAKDTRSELNENLKNDPVFRRLIESVANKLQEAVSKKKNYILVEPHSNETYNDEMVKILRQKGYHVNQHVEYKYEYDELYDCKMPVEYLMYYVSF